MMYGIALAMHGNICKHDYYNMVSVQVNQCGKHKVHNGIHKQHYRNPTKIHEKGLANGDGGT